MSLPRLQTVGLFAALTLAAVSVSHHLTYLLAHGTGGGYAEAMTERGHDAYWTDFLVVVGGAVLFTGIAAIRQAVRLTRQSRTTTASVADPGIGHLLRRFGPLFLKLALLTTAAFLVQENVELLAAGLGLPGVGVLGGDHSAAMPLILVVAAVIALVRALVEWRRDLLLARLRRLAARRRAHRELRRPDTRGIVLRSYLDASRNGTRAPPGAVAAPV